MYLAKDLYFKYTKDSENSTVRKYITKLMEFPGSPMVRDLHFHCPGHGKGMDLIHGRGIKIPQAMHVAWPKKRKETTK